MIQTGTILRGLRFIVIMAGIAILSLLYGCLTVESTRFSYNHETGEVVWIYHDIRSKNDPHGDSSPQKDWCELKKMLTEPWEPDDPVVTSVKKEIYQDGEVLSGRLEALVNCPECFPSKVAVLKYLLKGESDYRCVSVRGDILMLFPKERRILATNGRLLETETNWIILWEADVTRFEFEIEEAESGQTSLLPYFLEDTPCPETEEDEP